MFFLHFGLPKVSVFSEHIILVCSTMYIRICTSKTVILKNALDGECVKELECIWSIFFSSPNKMHCFSLVDPVFL